MNNPFDPKQLVGGKFANIAGSKLFAKAIPTSDTVTPFVLGKSTTSMARRRGGRVVTLQSVALGYPMCGEGCQTTPNGVSACSVPIYNSDGAVVETRYIRCVNNQPTEFQITTPSDASRRSRTARRRASIQVTLESPMDTYPECGTSCKNTPDGVPACSVPLYTSDGTIGGYKYYRCENGRPTNMAINTPKDAARIRK